MNGSNGRLRAVALAAMLFLAAAAGTVALAGSASAAATGVDLGSDRVDDAGTSVTVTVDVDTSGQDVVVGIDGDTNGEIASREVLATVTEGGNNDGDSASGTVTVTVTPSNADTVSSSETGLYDVVAVQESTSDSSVDSVTTPVTVSDAQSAQLAVGTALVYDDSDNLQGAYSSAQTAIDNAPTNGEVRLTGTFTEALTLDKDITLRAAEGASATVSYTGSGSSDGTATINVVASGATVKGLTVERIASDSRSDNGAHTQGIAVRASDVTVKKNTLKATRDAKETEFDGIVVLDPKSGSVSNVLVKNNNIKGFYSGVVVSTFYSGTLSGVDVKKNTVNNAHAGVVVKAHQSDTPSDVTVSGNTLNADAMQVYVSDSGDSYQGYSGLTAVPHKQVSVSDNTYERSATVSSAPDVYATIGGAIDAAGTGDTVTVGAGTYDERVVVDKDITLRAASGANPTIKYGDGSSAASTVHIPADGATFKGFTVKRGASNSNIGQGITVTGSNVLVANNDVKKTDSEAQNDQGIGVYDGLAGASNPTDTTGVTLKNNDVRGFQSGIGIATQVAGATVSDVTVTGGSVTKARGNNLGNGIGITSLESDDQPTGVTIKGVAVSDSGTGLFVFGSNSDHPADLKDIDASGFTVENVQFEASNDVQVVDHSASGSKLGIQTLLSANTFDQSVVVKEGGSPLTPVIYSDVSTAVDVAEKQGSSDTKQTVEVGAGTYPLADVVVSTPTITLQSAGDSRPTLEVAETNGQPIRVEKGASGFTMDGFRIEDRVNPGQAYVVSYADGTTISDLVVKRYPKKSSWTGASIQLRAVADGLVEDTKIINGAIGLEAEGGTVTAKQNTIKNPPAQGIFVYPVDSGDTLSLTKNTISNSPDADLYLGSTPAKLNGATGTQAQLDAVFADNPEITDITIAGTTYKRVSVGGTYYSSLQAAVDAASAGDTVTVGAGTYDSVTVDKAITVESAQGVTPTIDGGDSFALKTTAAATVRGFKLTTSPSAGRVVELGGAATFENNRVVAKDNQGLYSKSDVTIRNNEFVNKDVEGKSTYAIRFDDATGPEVVGGNTFDGFQHGILLSNTQNARIEGNTFRNGRTDGILLTARKGKVSKDITIRQNTFNDNPTAVILVEDVKSKSDSAIRNVDIHRNNFLNTEAGVKALDQTRDGYVSDPVTGTVDAAKNYWGAADGPSVPSDRSYFAGQYGPVLGSGATVHPSVAYAPFLNAPTGENPALRYGPTVDAADAKANPAAATQTASHTVSFSPTSDVDVKRVQVDYPGSPRFDGTVFDVQAGDIVAFGEDTDGDGAVDESYLDPASAAGGVANVFVDDEGSTLTVETLNTQTVSASNDIVLRYKNAKNPDFTGRYRVAVRADPQTGDAVGVAAFEPGESPTIQDEGTGVTVSGEDAIANAGETVTVSASVAVPDGLTVKSVTASLVGSDETLQMSKSDGTWTATDDITADTPDGQRAYDLTVTTESGATVRKEVTVPVDTARPEIQDAYIASVWHEESGEPVTFVGVTFSEPVRGTTAFSPEDVSIDGVPSERIEGVSAGAPDLPTDFDERDGSDGDRGAVFVAVEGVLQTGDAPSIRIDSHDVVEKYGDETPIDRFGTTTIHTTKLDLSEGKQLVSVPAVAGGEPLADLVDMNDPAVDSVWTYEDGQWQSWIPAEEAADDFTKLEGGQGYIFRMNRPATYGVNVYNVPAATSDGGAPTAPNSQTLQEGWNLVGHYQEGAQPAFRAFDSIQSGGSRAFTSVLAQRGDSLAYRSVPARPTFEEGPGGQLIRPGEAYWVFVTDDDQGYAESSFSQYPYERYPDGEFPIGEYPIPYPIGDDPPYPPYPPYPGYPYELIR